MLTIPKKGAFVVRPDQSGHRYAFSIRDWPNTLDMPDWAAS
jgi:hypothetical protein